MKQRAARFGIALSVLASACASAQSLEEPSPIERQMTATQFGMPRDAKFIFCDGPQCPHRSPKTLAALRSVARTLPAPVEVPRERIEPAAEAVKAPPSGHATEKTAPAKRAKKSAPRKRDSVTTECKPAKQASTDFARPAQGTQQGG